jgi:SAM-dependent methyltransferase
MLSKEVTAKVDKLFNSLSKNDEFEVMFNNYKKENKLPIMDFMKILKYVRYKSEKENYNITETTTLDAIYLGEDMSTYRVSIQGNETINNFLSLVHQRKNNMIFSILFSQYYNKPNFTFIQKIKDKDKIIDVDMFDIRFRVSKEISIPDNIVKNLSKLPISQTDKIIYRYKQRLTLSISPSLNIDLTMVKTSSNVNKINEMNNTYELEIDYSPDGKDKVSLKKILDEMEDIKKVLYGSNILISNEEENEVIENYKNLVYGSNNNTFNTLYSMQPISAEVQHFVDNIPNKYSVTDKADGDKYQMFIMDDTVYLISNNLHVKKLNKKVNNLNNTIVEGEYIYLSEQRKNLFMIFDCLYFKGKDLKNEVMLTDRLEKVYKISEQLNNKSSIYKIETYNNNFNLEKIKVHYNKEIFNFYKNLNKMLDSTSINGTVFHPKLFLFPTGGSSSEVFLFSDLIWINCTKNSNINCPYILDGIVFTGMEQKYSKDKKEHKFPIYKYKPPHTNSLDVYIEFEPNRETGGYMNIFDNSLPDKIEFKEFRVTNLFVGSVVGSREQPVPFMSEENNDQAYFPLVKGQVRDMEGNIILNKTVIEIIYTNDNSFPHPYRWTILRTRWDKTETVNKYKKRYGNYRDTAIKIWKSMIEAVTVEEINNLSQPNNYNSQMKILSSRLNTSIISSERKQDKYYQKVTNLIKKMREFHNWIKSVIIYTYCSPTRKEINGKVMRQSLLDIGCGRGGDILKMYHARVGEYVGFDPDYEGIYSSTDGAISRYNLYKSKFPDFGKVTYFLGDGGVKLDGETQMKSLTNMSQENKKIIDKVFTKDRKFDTFSSQFVIHYLFGNKTSIDNMVENINDFLRKDGYILLTLLDGDLVHKKFGEGTTLTSNYTDTEGQRNKLFEIVKKYSGGLNKDIGSPIDIHMSWISDDDKYIEEYLVPEELMLKTMKRAGCKLVDSELFKNVYTMNEPYFKNVIQYEENPKNKQFYEKVANFYGDLKGADKESRDWSFLFRFYIFQKVE